MNKKNYLYHFFFEKKEKPLYVKVTLTILTVLIIFSLVFSIVAYMNPDYHISPVLFIVILCFPFLVMLALVFLLFKSIDHDHKEYMKDK